MKANEFFKLHDLDFIKHLIAQNSNLTADYFDTCALYSFNGTPVVDGIDVPRKPFFDDLKHLVDSWELVEKLGGLEKVRKAINGKHIGYTHFYLHSNNRYVFLDHYVDFIPECAQHIGMFNKVIADVESCQ